jgi:hypothetical protein
MKKILFGALAAAMLLGTVSTASAQMTYGAADEYGSPRGSAVQQNWYGWLTTPFDPYSNASIGYNRNIAEPTNVGG